MGLIDKLVKSVSGGGTSAFENNVKLSQAKLEELLANFRPLNDFGGDLHDRLLRYVLDGVEDDAALAELAGRKDAADSLALLCASEFGIGQEKWGNFLYPTEQVDPQFYLRLVKVFEAAARSLPADRFFCQTEFDNALWLEILLQEATRTHAHTLSPEERSTGISGALIEAMVKADGREVHPFIRAPFLHAARVTHWHHKMRNMVLRVADLGKTYALHRDLIVPFLKDAKAETRLIAVENLARAGTPPTVFIAELVAAATCESKRVREAAEAMIATAIDAARPLLETIAQEGNRNEREQAVRVLGNICREQARPFLENLLAHETSAPVKEAIETVLANLRPPQGNTTDLLVPPPHVPLPKDSLVTAPLRACIERIVKDYNEYVTAHNEQVANKSSKTFIHPPGKLEFFGENELDTVCRLLQAGGDVSGHLSKTLAHARIYHTEPKGAVKDFLEHADCRLIHLIRFLAMINQIDSGYRGRSGISWHAALFIGVFRRSHEPKITLLHVAEALRDAGFSDEMLAAEVLGGYHGTFDWEPDALWPFLATQLERLGKTFEPTSGEFWERWQRKQECDGVLRLLAKFPQVPQALVGRLWDVAVGTAKADRLRAQRVVEKLPDLQERLATALGSGNYQTRSVAAEWLGRLGNKQAVAVLDAAARKEKHDAALDEILTALEKLGEAIEPYLDRKRLLADAEKGLKKGIPEALSWFPWAGLPKVHWSDTGKKIPPEVVTWLIVQNFKLKSAEAGPLLRRYCELIVPAEREELGRYVLAAWFDQDLLRKHTDAEARKMAQQQAPQTWQSYQQYLQWYQQQKQTPPALFQSTLAQVEQQLFEGLCRECGSATAEKGILAVAGACGGDALVPPVQKYLKEWYGYRAAQCKALIAMLSAVDRPAAIQYLLSIANRFRTKGIREEAEKYVHLLAERKGWTLDELADRTMPTAGLDDVGKLELNYGPRLFTARVNSDLEAVLVDATGKVLKNLPDPRQDDDAEQAKAAKAAFSAAKKELKKFAGMQATRLYEAMCTERTWPAADWRRYLLEHPLLKFLCQRLVWAVWEGGAANQTFRPLDDGTLTDYEDGAVTLADGATIRIAHGCQLSAGVAAGWQKHLADYDASPLFTQFGRAAYTLPAEKRSEAAIDEFQGFMVEAFKLRGMATKSGFTRGQAQDGGWFYDYQKPFPGLGLIASLEFSGNGLPEENRQVALKGLSFRKSAPQEAGFQMHAGSLPLGEIPGVLLTECYNELASIAKSGSGFDPDWEKKVY